MSIDDPLEREPHQHKNIYDDQQLDGFESEEDNNSEREDFQKESKKSIENPSCSKAI